MRLKEQNLLSKIQNDRNHTQILSQLRTIFEREAHSLKS